MNKFATRKNKKGAHKQIDQVLITRIVAMPLYPAYDKGKPLSAKTFDVVLHHDPNKMPTKKSWGLAVQEATKACQEFISKQANPSKWWVMNKGHKTSFKVSTRKLRGH